MPVIRNISEQDAERFLNLCRQLDEETSFMLVEPGERQTTVEEQREKIKAILARDNQTIFVADAAGELAGFVAGLGGAQRRNRATIGVVIGVLERFSGRGLATRLMNELEHWAKANRFHRLELTVMAHNARAIGFYRKMGFVIEGSRRQALLISGALVDEFYLAKLLASPKSILDSSASK